MKKTISFGNRGKRLIALLSCWAAMMLCNSAFALSISVPTSYTTINSEDSSYSVTTADTITWYKFTSTNTYAEMDVLYDNSPHMDSVTLWVQSGSVITYIQSAVRVVDQYIIYA